jgi:hypothetical protein
MKLVPDAQERYAGAKLENDFCALRGRPRSVRLLAVAKLNATYDMGCRDQAPKNSAFPLVQCI